MESSSFLNSGKLNMEPQLLLPKSNEGKNNNILSKNTTMLNNKKQNKKGKYDNNKSLGAKGNKKNAKTSAKGGKKVMKVVTVNVASNNKNASTTKKICFHNNLQFNLVLDFNNRDTK